MDTLWFTIRQQPRSNLEIRDSGKEENHHVLNKFTALAFKSSLVNYIKVLMA